jgi:hypothetical protein
MLVATGALPARDEQMARLERWFSRTIAGRENPDEQHLLHRYATWYTIIRWPTRRGCSTPTSGHKATW